LVLPAHFELAEWYTFVLVFTHTIPGAGGVAEWDAADSWLLLADFAEGSLFAAAPLLEEAAGDDCAAALG